MAGFVSLSMSACSVDYDGNNENDADLIGTWDAISQQYYADNEGYGKPGPAGGYWVITARTITEYQQVNAAAITTATVIARIISSILNFSLNQFWCFRSKEKVTRSGLRYIILLVVQMGMSAGLVTLFSTIFASTLVVKMFVDVGLSVFSYYAQKHWVFKKKEENHGKQQQTAGAVL